MDAASASHSRVVEWRCYQSGSAVMDDAVTKRLRVTPRGVELHHPKSPYNDDEDDVDTDTDNGERRSAVVTKKSNQPAAAAAATPSTAAKAYAVHGVIPWEDVLGAAVLDSSAQAAALVPGYTQSSSSEKGVEFVVFACVPKPKASRWRGIVFGSKFDAFSCFGRRESDDQDGAGVSVSDIDRSSVSKATPVNGEDGATAPTEPRQRVLVQWVFRYTGDDAAAYATRTVHAIQGFADPRLAHSIRPATGKELPQLSHRKYLILINPAGGAGNAQSMYDNVVAPMLLQSGIEAEVIVTQRQYHASDVMEAAPLGAFDCIVAVGGDGLLSEILQGIMRRPDWEQAVQQPLGIIPGGSGNGLAASLMYRSGEAHDALNATFALIKGAASELDISSMSDGRQKVVYSFLSLEWAFIADVDIESERYRMFGGLRFTVSSVAKILSRHKQYNGTLRYLDSDQDARLPTKFHERVRDPLASSEDATRPALECLSQRDAPSQDPLSTATGQWKELTGSFHMFWAMNVTHAASDGHIAPMAGMDDGYFYLMLMEGPFSRMSLAKLLLGLEDGSHIGQKRVQVIRTRAFTLHTDNPTDLLCVDGELFKGPDVQVEVHRAMGRIMCLPERR